MERIRKRICDKMENHIISVKLATWQMRRLSRVFDMLGVVK